MKKITILIITIISLTLLLYGCNNLDNKINQAPIPNLAEEEDLDYGVGEEIENGVGEVIEPPVLEEQAPSITSPPKTASADYEVQSLVTLNIRDNPSSEGKVLGVITQSQTLPFVETLNSWHKVLYKDTVAYVSAKSNYSRLKPLVSNGDVVEKIIEIGMSLLGIPYEFGSTRVIDYNFKPIKAFTGRTFDCSAFVQYSFYKGANIHLYGDSRTMSKQGSLVSYANIKRGDVIFMTSSARQYNTGLERIGHVGIYLGDNKLLHTYGTGGVRITEFNSFWRGRFISAKSML